MQADVESDEPQGGCDQPQESAVEAEGHGDEGCGARDEVGHPSEEEELGGDGEPGALSEHLQDVRVGVGKCSGNEQGGKSQLRSAYSGHESRVAALTISGMREVTEPTIMATTINRACETR